jgi:hypothetical protein
VVVGLAAAVDLGVELFAEIVVAERLVPLHPFVQPHLQVPVLHKDVAAAANSRNGAAPPGAGNNDRGQGGAYRRKIQRTLSDGSEGHEPEASLAAWNEEGVPFLHLIDYT